MTKFLITAAAALALTGPVYAKSHDQGAADGERGIVNLPDGGQLSVEPGGLAGSVDDVVRFGLTGDGDTDAPGNANAEGRRAAKGGNGVKPVVGNGKNSR